MNSKKDIKLAEEVNKLYDKLSKKEMNTLMKWVSANCDVVKGNKCDECGTELEKTFILTRFDVPIVAWICPKSEMYQLYKIEFEKYQHKN